MKKLIFMLTLMFTAGTLIAQSDYEKVQNFKNEIAEIEAGVQSAESVAVLDSLQNRLNQLKEKYIGEKDLLDQSLYPDDFEGLISGAGSAIELRRKDFTQIEELEVTVERLKGELEKLNDKNSSLLAEIKRYQQIGGSPEEVKNLVSELQLTLRKRDALVRNMLDSLLSDFVNHPMTLSDAEKQAAYEKIETGNLFYNIEKTIRDNIEFLKVTSLEPADLSEVKEDQLQFYTLWKRIGPGIADAYSGSKDKSGEVAYITNLFSQWEQNLDSEIWKDVNEVFIRNNLKLDEFESGNEFVESIIDYIESQMGSFNDLGYDESYSSFEKFKEIWQEDLKSTWLPILVDNEIVSVEQYETISDKMDEWEKIYEVETFTWWYFLIVLIVIAVVIVVFINRNKRARNIN